MALALDDTAQPNRRRRPAVDGSPDAPPAVRPSPDAPPAARALALQRVLGHLSPDLDLDAVLRDVVSGAQTLFGAELAGLWLAGEGEHPLRLAAHEGIGRELIDAVALVARHDDLPGVGAPARHGTKVVEEPERDPHFGDIYRRMGVRTVAYVPLVAADRLVGLLVLGHHAPYAWTDAELDLCGSFAGQTATAIANARLSLSVQTGAARLSAIAELSGRLNRIRDVEGISAAIVEGMDRLIRHDTIRVYRVDAASGMCEPVAFQGEVSGIGRPSLDRLRVPIGTGLTGWVALHGTTLRLGNASSDPRSVQMGANRGVESMLLVPMDWEDRVVGVIVVSTAGYDQYTEDDERMLEIFAGYAAQAMANAEAFAEVRRQRAELHHLLDGQRRLREVSEKLLSTLDPGGVLEMIADSLKAVVAYDALTIYRIDWSTRRQRAVVARDRFAELILQHESDIGDGLTGWAIHHAEAVLANDAHLDPRVAQIPGTPDEPESMIVCPLMVGGEVVGTLNVSRMGGPEAHFSGDEFELVQLFAAQASIALRNAETHGEMVTRAERDALTGLRNHGAFQRELGEAVAAGRPFALLMMDLDAFKAYNDSHGHPAGDALLARIAGVMRETLRDEDRVYRYGGDEFAVLLPRAGAAAAREVSDRLRAAVARLTEQVGPPVTATVGVAVHPDDGATKDALVEAADRALYLAKPPSRSRDAGGDPTRDPFLAAVDQTTLRLMERLEPAELLRDIVERAAALVGVKHGYLYLLEPADDGEADLVVRVGTGVFADLIGYRLPRGVGLGWAVLSSGRPMVVDDYAEYAHRAPELAQTGFGAVCAVPLTSGGETVGLIGLASGDTGRPFSEREMEALSRFAQLASVALDNGRLFERAQTEVRRRAHAALHDPLTGLPNRTLLLNRLAEQLQPDGRADPVGIGRPSGARIALVLLDLDRFTMVNDTLGHGVGDLLLSEVARRVVAVARTTDTVARLGPDEFGVLLGAVRSVREAQRVARRIERELALPFELDGHEVRIAASLGLAIGRTLGTYPNDLLREAEIALRRSKADPALGTVLFDPEMRAQTVERTELEHDLRRAIERREFRLHYQPIMDLQRGVVVGVEALLRWQHPLKGLIDPDVFIPVAEETGLMEPIGDWVLQEACVQAAAWRTGLPPLRVAINLSGRQILDGNLADTIQDTLGRLGLRPGDLRLELEVTERMLSTTERSLETLRNVRSLGIHIAIDDFGTGYSSLSQLKRLPVDTLKIDRSFMQDIPDNPGDQAIAAAIISLGHTMDLKVVAEGVETAAQLSFLEAQGCDEAQGFLFSKPVSSEQIRSLVNPGQMTA